MAFVVALFVTLTFLSSMYRKDQLNKRLEKEKLETELNFLKSQTSPHFLFNALNSIYVLIDIDKKKAREILLRFSGLLGYQLYECKDLVYLSKELDFLENYIELEKIRKKNLVVSYNRPVNSPAFEIVPFLLIPFVENAFKHVSSYNNRENFIKINISANDLLLNAEVINTYEENDSVKDGIGGIGLQNIQRILHLLYPDVHEFKIHKEQNIFTAKLTIYADKNKLHHN
jgi:LytS/YehU family sensor histidine kinase